MDKHSFKPPKVGQLYWLGIYDGSLPVARRLEAGRRNVRDLLIEWPLANGHLLTHRLLGTTWVLRISESERKKKIFDSKLGFSLFRS